MASMIASKRAPLAQLLQKLLVSSSSPLRSVAIVGRRGADRGYTTNSQLRDYDDEPGDRDLDAVADRRRGDHAVSRRRGEALPGLLSDMFNPFAPLTLSQMRNLMDQMLDNPFPVAGRGAGTGLRQGWDAREDDKALYLRVDMPGLGKEHVKVWAEQNTVVIKGEGEKESEEEEETGRKYSSRIDLPPETFHMDQIKAEMKNGVLKVVLPKVKEEERGDIFQVKIE